MANIKPSTHGIVVDHKETEIRYAVSDRNYNPEIHRKVRDLKPGETILGFQPKRKGALADNELPETPNPNDVPKTTEHVDTTQTEGSSSEGTKDTQ
jgi:hypothetical protein